MANEKMSIYEQLKSVPQEAQKEIKGGRLKGMTDINPMWRIQKLTETFGACGFGWYTDILDENFIEGANGEMCCFIKINLYVKQGNEWSKGIIGIGGSTFVANESTGKYTSDEAMKMAYTDAISVACKSLGMAADIYWGSEKATKYDAPKSEGNKLASLECIEIKYGTYAGKKFKDLTAEERQELRNDKSKFIREKMIEYDDLLNPDMTPILDGAIEIKDDEIPF